MRRDMGLDQPIWWRYLSWLGNVMQGDFGRSFRTGQTVLQAVSERLPVSIELMLLAQVGALAIGVPLVIVCAARSGGPLDRFMTGSAFGMLSVPTFLSAILLIYLFAVELRWLPATAMRRLRKIPGQSRFFVLPSLTLALAEWPGIMRVLRSDMIVTLQEDYIALAKAKGLTPARILFVHALKPSSLTLVTITGINIGRLIGGAVIVETIFALPGIGRLLIGAILTRDLIILQGVVLLVGAGFVIMNFIVDLLYAVLDPGLSMATLELEVAEEAVSQPVRKGRRLGMLFWAAVGCCFSCSPWRFLQPSCRCQARPTWTCWSGVHRFRRNIGLAPTGLVATSSRG